MIVLADDGTVDHITTRFNSDGENAEDYITCPACRRVIPLGEKCKCPASTRSQ